METTRSYVVKVAAGDTTYQKIWHVDEPLEIGYPVRYVLERTEKGVILRNFAAEAAGARVPGARAITQGELSGKEKLRLPSARGMQSSYSVELKPVDTLPPAYATHPETGHQLRVYAFRGGDWAYDCNTVTSKYAGYVNLRRAFLIRKTGQGGVRAYQVKSRRNGLTIDILKEGRFETIELKKGASLEFSAQALAGSIIRLGERSEWRLEVITPNSTNFLTRPISEANDEDQILKKSFQAAGIFFLLLLGIAWLIPGPEAPEKQEIQTTKIIFEPKKKIVKGLMTAAPKGDRNARDFSIGKSGDSKSAGRKGSAGPAKVAKNQTTPRASRPVVERKSQTKSAKRSSVTAQRKATPGSAKKGAASSKRASAKPTKTSRSQTANLNRGKRAGEKKAVSAASAATQGLLSGGMTQLLAKSKYSSGADARAESRAILAGSGGSGLAGLGGSSAPSSGGVHARSVEVGGMGGDGGPGSKGAGYGRGSHARVSGQGKSFVSLDDGASNVEEGLTKDQVGRVIHRHMDEIRYCYEAAILRTPEVEGRISMAFTIGSNGRVQRASAARSSVSDGRLDNCIASRLKSWQFPRPKGGVNVAVTYPFIFKTL